MINEVYTIIRWNYDGPSWSGNKYVFDRIECSFSSRKEANAYLKICGAVYENGYYTKGTHIYSVKKNKFDYVNC